MRGSWSEKRARWYLRAVQESDYPQRVFEALDPVITETESLLDVGAGIGALSFPAARRFKRVTALDPSLPMLRVLEEEAKLRGIENIRILQGSWDQVELEPQSVILCANVPPVLDNIASFGRRATSLASSLVAVVTRAGRKGLSGADKFYFQELYPLLLGRPFGERPDYRDRMQELLRLGLGVRRSVIEYDLDQPFRDLDEAVDFWRELLGLEPGPHDELLATFLSERLERTPEGLVRRIRSRSALLWWPVEGA